MGVPEDCRSPGADVIDVALAVGVPQVRAFAAGEEARRSADRAKRAHRRIHPAGDAALGAREQFFVTAHGAPWCAPAPRRGAAGVARRANAAPNAPAAAVMSVASNTALMTASASAPAAVRAGARVAVMPPMATTGTVQRALARVSRAGSARTASGLTRDG